MVRVGTRFIRGTRIYFSIFYVCVCVIERDFRRLGLNVLVFVFDNGDIVCGVCLGVMG